MSTLNELPNEIKLYILSFLDLISLLNMSCVNKFFFINGCKTIKKICKQNIIVGNINKFTRRKIEKRLKILFFNGLYDNFYDSFCFFKEFSIAMKELVEARVFDFLFYAPGVPMAGDLLFLARSSYTLYLTEPNLFKNGSIRNLGSIKRINSQYIYYLTNLRKAIHYLRSKHKQDTTEFLNIDVITENYSSKFFLEHYLYHTRWYKLLIKELSELDFSNYVCYQSPLNRNSFFYFLNLIKKI